MTQGKSLLTLSFDQIELKDVSLVGGKNASLGEMIRHLQPLGINIPDGFATTAEAFQLYLDENNLRPPIKEYIQALNKEDFSNLTEIASSIKTLLLKSKLPKLLSDQITDLYDELCIKHQREIEVAVRSSATAEDLPTASFAGQHESFLNIRGSEAVIDAVRKCFASLYNARAIKYRIDHGFDHEKISLSAGIQMMVRADLASSGVCFTIDPETGFGNVIVISGCWGLGENIVQGTVNPDEFHVFKPHLGKFSRPVISKKLGTKAKTIVYSPQGGVINTDTVIERQQSWTLNDQEIETLGKWALQIEDHYHMPMDIEWAKDGIDGKLYIVQARPETVHSLKDPYQVKEFNLLQKSIALTSGSAIGSGITSGIARIIHSPSESEKLKKGEILVTEYTNPDWDPIMKKAAAIVTNKGGRTSHAAIVAREIGALAIVGANDATLLIKDGESITVDNSQGTNGTVYQGQLKWEVMEHDFRNLRMPQTKAMLILADPDNAYKYSFYPNQGVGLLRMEFAINHSIKVHPMALVHFNEIKHQETQKQIEALTASYQSKTEYFVDKLSQAVGTIAAAFYPKEVIVRMSDFKSNEYANLIGGKEFELNEENPMIGFRGASRYYHPNYAAGFQLECEAMKRVRDEMGLKNVKLMIPFCRTVDEGKKVIALMEKNGLKQGENGLEIYVMAEIPSNVIQAEDFAEVFDGFSIGSNDLTQLILGIDRDSEIISGLFDEKNQSVRTMIQQIIQTAKRCKTKIGLCGQAPSDFPEFAGFLVNLGIDSISFTPDSLIKGIENMNKAELNKTI